MYVHSNQIIIQPPKENRINTNMLSIFISRCAVLLCLVTQLCPTVCDPMDCSPPGPSIHGDSPGKNTGVGCHVLLQGIFPTQRLNPGLLHCRQILDLLSHQGSSLESPNRDENNTYIEHSCAGSILPSFAEITSFYSQKIF